MDAMYMLFAATITVLFGMYIYETERRILSLKDEFEKKMHNHTQNTIDTVRKDIAKMDINLTNTETTLRKDIMTFQTGINDILSAIQSRQLELERNVTVLAEQYGVNDKTITNLNRELKGLFILTTKIEKETKDNNQNINNEIANLSTLQKGFDQMTQQYKQMEATIVNLSKHVSFSAKLGKIIPNIEPEATIVFDSLIINSGNGYNAGTGIFKAPISGVYFFTSSILTMQPSTVEMELRVNGRTQMWMYTCARNLGHNNAVNSLILRLEVGDEVKIVKNKFGGRPFYIHDLWSTFSGFLLNANVL